MIRRTIVVALGGNALIPEGTRGTVEEQRSNAQKSVGAIVGLIRQGRRVVLTHGNGPQAGIHLIRSEAASARVPGSPINITVADNQGSMGYLIAQCLSNALIKEKMEKRSLP
jgi:carbamate kinase